MANKLSSLSEKLLLPFFKRAYFLKVEEVFPTDVGSGGFTL